MAEADETTKVRKRAMRVVSGAGNWDMREEHQRRAQRRAQGGAQRRAMSQRRRRGGAVAATAG